MSRPEDLLPPDLYYNDIESAKYTTSSRIQAIQSSMTHRALALLDLPSSSWILDVGCGSGLSGEILSTNGHFWVGMDISPSMLDIALQRQDEAAAAAAPSSNASSGSSNDGTDDDDSEAVDEVGNGDLLLGDMGQGLPFLPGSFDAAISISAVQWLCNAESSNVSPEARLRRFFDSLYSSLKRGGKAVLQFYPKNDVQRNMITQAAIRAGFGAGLLEDDGGTKNAKLYLVLSVGGGDITQAVNRMEGVDVEDGRRVREALGNKKKRGELVKGSKGWVKKKKEKMKAKGKIVKTDSKYTGRRRGPKF